MTRAEKVTEAQRLRAEGLKLREIAERMGASPTTVSGWLSDPDLSKQRARRARYAQPCLDCGAQTSGSGGFAVRHERCLACETRRAHEERYWTPERVVATLQAWATDLGRAPCAHEAHVAGAPIPQAITAREFGSWNAALRAAGFTPRGPGDRLSYHTRWKAPA